MAIAGNFSNSGIYRKPFLISRQSLGMGARRLFRLILSRSLLLSPFPRAGNGRSVSSFVMISGQARQIFLRKTSKTITYMMKVIRKWLIMGHMKMSLQDYKAKVGECLTKNLKASIQEKEDLMKEYDPDFQEFLEEGLSPEATAAGMAMHLL